jgi:hypothetical protein
VQVFLSTDAGGVGLNLQAASAVVNFEPPWNPARLEQRVGRVHRLGQSRPVHVIHMLTSDSIEERVWETLRLKKSLFAGVFDSPTGEVSFEKLGRKTVLQAVKEIFASQPARPKPVVDSPPPVALKPIAAGASEPAALPTPTKTGGVETAAAGLVEAGVKFIESIFTRDGSAKDSSGASASRLEQILSGLCTRDTRTNKPILSIPLPESVNQERIARAISILVNSLGQSASEASKTEITHRTD